MLHVVRRRLASGVQAQVQLAVRAASTGTSSTAHPVLRAVLAATPQRVAIVDAAGPHSYAQLLRRAQRLSARLPKDGPIALLLPQDASLVTALLAAWMSRVPAVPLSPLYPAAALAPLLQDVGPAAVVSCSDLALALPATSAPVLLHDHDNHDANGDDGDDGGPQMGAMENLAEGDAHEAALVFFTSGTTGSPKGVVWTHDMLHYQLSTLSSAWHWSSNDHILNVLPLHHVHGLVNVVLSSLYNHATLAMHRAFDAYSVWAALVDPNAAYVTGQLSVFMAVPTVYRKLLAWYEQATPKEQKRMRAGLARVRLFVSGSAALPERDFARWRELSGQCMLERYGMTETGMALSNDYGDRRCGLLGAALPGVSARVAGGADSGELLIKGRGVFSSYWCNADKTSTAFDDDGYFRTGDIVQREDGGYFRMLGRASSDFIKCAGYRVSGVEVERVLRQVHGVLDCCVVGLADDMVGQRVVAALVVADALNDDVPRFVKGVLAHAKLGLPMVKVPTQFFKVDALPRNVLGKVQKNVLASRLAESGVPVSLSE